MPTKAYGNFQKNLDTVKGIDYKALMIKCESVEVQKKKPHLII